MGRIEDLFAMLENESEFRKLDSRIMRECGTRLQPIRARLSQMEYEQMRDVVFSVAHAAKKSSFEIGFKQPWRWFLSAWGTDNHIISIIFSIFSFLRASQFLGSSIVPRNQ